jgi:hypothetical protein
MHNIPKRACGLFLLIAAYVGSGCRKEAQPVSPGEAFRSAANQMTLSATIPKPSRTSLVAANTGISLEIFAHPWSLTKPIGVSPGHATMCIALRLNSGIKEDCYGFFLRKVKDWRISGPGVKRDAVNDPEANVSRFAGTTVSMKMDITEAQRRAIIAAADEWNNRHYDLSKENCIDFVAQAARLAGWITPARKGLSDTPESWVRELGVENKLLGFFSGTATGGQVTLPMSVEITASNGSAGGQINLNDMGDTFRDVSVQGQLITFVVGTAGAPFRFSGGLSPDGKTLSGSWILSGNPTGPPGPTNGSFNLTRQ